MMPSRPNSLPPISKPRKTGHRVQAQPPAQYLRRQVIPFNRLHDDEYRYDARDSPDSASVGQGEARGEDKAERRPYVRDGVQKTRQARLCPPRPGP